MAHQSGLKSFVILAPNTAFRGRKQPCALMFVGCRYLAYGTSMDFMHAEMHVPYALTWEVGLSCQ